MESIDSAQVVLYVFWFFFFGLIVWLRREDRREGYPLEGERTGKPLNVNPIFIPPPKTFLLPDGGTRKAPDFVRDTRPVDATRTGGSGFPLKPNGNPLLSNVGPASYAERADHYELTREGQDVIVPMRSDPEYSISAGPDPRGFKVVAADKKVAGVVKDVWVDRADVMIRYLEMELASGNGTRLIPFPMMLADGETRKIEVVSLLAKQFDDVPGLKDPNRITVLEEEKISAYYAGGRLFAEPKRAEPMI